MVERRDPPNKPPANSNSRPPERPTESAGKIGGKPVDKPPESPSKSGAGLGAKPVDPPRDSGGKVGGKPIDKPPESGSKSGAGLGEKPPIKPPDGPPRDGAGLGNKPPDGPPRDGAGLGNKPPDGPPRDGAGLGNRPPDGPPRDGAGLGNRPPDGPPRDGAGLGNRPVDPPRQGGGDDGSKRRDGGAALGSRERPPRQPPPGEERPPPGPQVSRSTWNWMSPAEAAKLWARHRDIRVPGGGAGGGSGGGVKADSHATYVNLNSPPPGSDIPIGVWRTMDLDERDAAWSTYRTQVISHGDDHRRPPPGWGVSMAEWNAMSPEDRAGEWGYYDSLVEPGERVVNAKIIQYQAKHPKIVTVQDLVNEMARLGKSDAERDAELVRLGLDPAMAMRFRFVPLRNFATVPISGTIRTLDTVEEANRYFVTQYHDANYNPANTSDRNWSMNCGPASLLMVLRSKGLVPGGLTDEQEIDYVRAMMCPPTPSCTDPAPVLAELRKNNQVPPGLSEAEALEFARKYACPRPRDLYKEQVLPDGRKVLLLDQDFVGTGIGQVAVGAAEGGSVQHRGGGWAQLDAALRAHEPVIINGSITSEWTAQFAGSEGSYGGWSPYCGHWISVLGMTPGGEYIVADPMFTGGTVAMTREQLIEFFKTKDENTGKIQVDNAPTFLSAIDFDK